VVKTFLKKRRSMQLVEKNFLIYKLLNSSFTGLSIGILFKIYEPLDPEIYSIGGMVLAVAMIVIAKFYERLLNIQSFYRISLFVEAVMLLTVISFLVLGYSLTSALLIYCGYQLTFIFGGYLVRAETLVTHRKELLSKIDMLKQAGYLVGLGASFLFYKVLDMGLGITVPNDQIIVLHYVLILLQSIILLLVISSFKKG
jgi:putative membrane protein